jgi:hypothetical protein
MIAPSSAAAPYQITVEGGIGRGAPYGQGLCINAGRTSVFRLSGIYTLDTNVVVGRGVGQVVIDGGGLESSFTYNVDPTSRGGITFPVRSQSLLQ